MTKKTKEKVAEVQEELTEKSIETTDKIKKIEEKKTMCYLASKANYLIEVKYNGQTTFIQPFGRIKVIKENIKLNSNDAKYLTFIKI